MSWYQFTDNKFIVDSFLSFCIEFFTIIKKYFKIIGLIRSPHVFSLFAWQKDFTKRKRYLQFLFAFVCLDPLLLFWTDYHFFCRIQAYFYRISYPISLVVFLFQVLCFLASMITLLFFKLLERLSLKNSKM